MESPDQKISAIESEQKEEFAVGEKVVVADQYVDENIEIPEKGPAYSRKAEIRQGAIMKKYQSLQDFNGRLVKIVGISEGKAKVMLESDVNKDSPRIIEISLEALIKPSREELEERENPPKLKIGDEVRLRRSTGGGLKAGMIGRVYDLGSEESGIAFVSFKIPEDMQLTGADVQGDEYKRTFMPDELQLIKPE